MKIKTITAIIFLFSCIIIQTACDSNIIGCTLPPQPFSFALKDKDDKSLISNDNKDLIKITFTDNLGVPQSLVDAKAMVFKDTTNSGLLDHVINSYEILSKSNEMKDPVFDIQLSKKSIGNIQLKTIVNTAHTDKWIDVSEVFFNGKKVEISKLNGFYILKTD